MTAINSLITAAVGYETSQPGVKPVVYLGNFEEIASYTEAAGIVTAITMDSLKTFFQWDGYNRSVNAMSEMVKNDFGVFYKHSVSLKAFTQSDATKQQVMKAGVTRLVAIVENYTKNGDMTFEIYGLDNGLTAQSISKNMQEGGGVWDILLESDDPIGLEQNDAKTLFITSYAATLAVVQGLL